MVDFSPLEELVIDRMARKIQTECATKPHNGLPVLRMWQHIGRNFWFEVLAETEDGRMLTVQTHGLGEVDNSQCVINARTYRLLDRHLIDFCKRNPNRLTLVGVRCDIRWGFRTSVVGNRYFPEFSWPMKGKH